MQLNVLLNNIFVPNKNLRILKLQEIHLIAYNVKEEKQNALRNIGQAIGQLNNLQTLSLNQNSEIFPLIESVILSTSSITDLDLSSNSIFDTNFIPIVKAFESNKSIQKLLLKKNFISNQGAITLGNMMRMKPD